MTAGVRESCLIELSMWLSAVEFLLNRDAVNRLATLILCHAHLFFNIDLLFSLIPVCSLL